MLCELVIIVEIDGVVCLGDIVKGMCKVFVENELGELCEYFIL